MLEWRAQFDAAMAAALGDDAEQHRHERVARDAAGQRAAAGRRALEQMTQKFVQEPGALPSPVAMSPILAWLVECGRGPVDEEAMVFLGQGTM